MNLLVGPRGREDPRPDVLGELDRGRPRSTRRRVDEHAFAGSEIGAVVEPEPGEMKGEVERGGAGKWDRLRHVEGRNDRTDREFGEAAVGALGHRDDAATLPFVGALAARVDDPHDLHARAVRQLGTHHHVAAGDAFEIVEIERDGLHPNADLAGLGCRDGNGVESEYLRGATVFVRPPCSHRAIRVLHRCSPAPGFSGLLAVLTAPTGQGQHLLAEVERCV